jgi:hypothetical protein
LTDIFCHGVCYLRGCKNRRYEIYFCGSLFFPVARYGCFFMQGTEEAQMQYLPEVGRPGDSYLSQQL